jgi:hypothetical protein
MNENNVITVGGFKDYMKENESAFRAENEIIAEKLAQGINGLEWLVMQVVVDYERMDGLNRFIKHCIRVDGKEFISVLKDAIVMHHEEFYEKHELNWWIAVDDSFTFLAFLKEKNYDEYFTLVQSIYQK